MFKRMLFVAMMVLLPSVGFGEVIEEDNTGGQKPVSISFEWTPYLEQCAECTEHTIEFYIDGGPATASISIDENTYTTSYIDDGVSHNYWIRAKDPTGRESGNSEIVAISPWFPPTLDPELPVTLVQPGTPDGMKYRLIFENVTIEEME